MENKPACSVCSIALIIAILFLKFLQRYKIILEKSTFMVIFLFFVYRESNANHALNCMRQLKDGTSVIGKSSISAYPYLVVTGRVEW